MDNLNWWNKWWEHGQSHVLAVLCRLGVTLSVVYALYPIILYCKKQRQCRKQGPDPRTLLSCLNPLTFGLPSRFPVWPWVFMEQWPNFRSRDAARPCLGAVGLPVPHQGPSPPLLGSIIQTGQKLAAATFLFSNPAYEKLAFMVVILHIRRIVPQFLLDRIGLEQQMATFPHASLWVPAFRVILEPPCPCCQRKSCWVVIHFLARSLGLNILKCAAFSSSKGKIYPVWLDRHYVCDSFQFVRCRPPGQLSLWLQS